MEQSWLASEPSEVDAVKNQAQDFPNSNIVYEFKIDGMTCVQCSSAVERGMGLAFKDRGLIYDE